MGKKIFCENLPLDKTVREFLGLLDPIGTVQWVLMLTDPKTHRPTGEAYVEMWSDTEAELVISQWNGQPWEGSVLNVRMVKTEAAPDAQLDKTPILNTPPNYIYSVIRYQINAPVGSVIFINNIAKAIVDETGNGVVRGLLPGDYVVKAVLDDTLLITQPISINCDEEPPRLNVSVDMSKTQAMTPAEMSELTIDEVATFMTGKLAVFKTQAINVTPAGVPTMFMPKTDADAVIASKTTPKSSKKWLMIAVAVIVIGVGSVIAMPWISSGKGPLGPPPPPPAPKAPDGMAFIPVNNKFVIGRISTDDDYQKPAYETTLSSSYFMDKTEVTNEDYLRFVQETKRTPPPHWGGAAPPANILRLPVTHVNWDDANSYCSWKGTRTGLICRLPSEFEWEHAARGDKNVLYVWGNDWENGLTNANQPNGKILPVGSSPKDMSPYGLMDMNGNVREWTRDFLSVYPNSKAQYYPGVKVARGGAFSDGPDKATSTYRSFLPPDDRTYDRTGFRCLCEVSVATTAGK